MFPCLPERLKWKLKVLVTPKIWIRNNHDYCEKYDKWLNACMDEGIPFIYKNGWEFSVLDVSIWYQNHPYASFTTKFPRIGSVICSRATSLRAWDYWQKTIDKQMKILPPIPCKELD